MEREKLPDAVWGNMMTFLGESRACIGWRFSLIEQVLFLCSTYSWSHLSLKQDEGSPFTLVRAFEFKLDVPQEEVLVVKRAAVLRPIVKGIAELPLVITPVKDN